MKKNFLIIIIIFFNFLNLNAQNKFIDSLIQKAENTNEDSLKIDIYHQIYFNQIIENPLIALNTAKKICEFAKKNNNNKLLCLTLNSIGDILLQTGKKDSAYIILQKSLNISDSIKFLYGMAINYNSLSRINFLSDNYEYAIRKAEKALKIFIQLDSIKSISNCYNAIGNAYKDMGTDEKNEDKKNKYYDRSLENYFKAMKTTKQIKRKAVFLANIANTFIQQKKYQLALKNAKKAVEYAEQSEDNYSISYTYLIKGWSLNFLKKNEIAIKDLKKSRKYAEKLKNKASILWATRNLMDVYFDLGLFKKAFTESKKYIELKDSLFALKKQKIINNIEIKYSTKEKEQQNQKLKLQKKNDKKLISLQKRLLIATIISILLMIFLLTILAFVIMKKKKAEKRIFKLMSELKENKSKISTIFEKSIEGIFVVLNSKVIFANPQTCKLLKCNLKNVLGKNLLDFIYEEDKNNIATEFLSKLNKNNFIIEYQSRYVTLENEVRWANVNAARIVWDKQEANLIFFTDITDRKKAENRIIKQSKILRKQNEKIIIQNNELNQYSQELNTTNEELNTTLEFINEQKMKIEEAHKNIKASINYASRIQNAILPDLQIFEKLTTNYFILFKPRDIVSGDFYWAKQIGDYFIYVTADCTGHGIPGAFVSMLGISLLNEILNKQVIQAEEILNILRREMKNSLKQKGISQDETKDGMDLALCIINTKTNELQFAGANNPLYLIRNNELIEFKADRQPIGIYRNEKPFTNHLFQLKKNDKLYTFSDGYIDQFGGKKGKKFMKKRFKKLLLSIKNKTMSEQKQILDTIFKNWKSNIEQIDDVLVVGVKI